MTVQDGHSGPETIQRPPSYDSGDTTVKTIRLIASTTTTITVLMRKARTISTRSPLRVLSTADDEVSTVTSTYRPLIMSYMVGTTEFAQPEREIINEVRWVRLSSRVRIRHATLNSAQINFLPLNVPLHLFVDRALTNASGSGPYTIRMQDITVSFVGVFQSD